MIAIGKEFTFEAMHSLTKVPEGHKCGREHGHSYKVEVVLQNRDVNAMGFIVDYADISAYLKPIIDEFFDHHNLNVRMELAIERVIPDVQHVFEDRHLETTAENIAHVFYLICQKKWGELVYSVTVRETATTFATVFAARGR